MTSDMSTFRRKVILSDSDTDLISSGLSHKALYRIWRQIKFAHNSGIYAGAKGCSVVAF